MHPRNKLLLLDLVGRRDDGILPRTREFADGDGELTPIERQRICELINEEFLQAGIGPDFSPTALGLELESLLDEVNAVRLRPGASLRKTKG